MTSEKKAARIRILVADANGMFCELLQAVLRRRRAFEVVACATTVRELVVALESHTIDIALVGAHLKDGKNCGLKAVQQMRALRPQIRSVVLLNASEKNLALEAFRAGAKGVFPRSETNIDVLAKCVDRVHGGQIWATSAELEQLIEGFRNPAPLTITDAKGTKLLSNQEAKIARLVAEGRTNREIALQLALSEHTVKNYLFKVFDKLGISNRVELVLYAMSQATETESSAALDGPDSRQAS